MTDNEIIKALECCSTAITAYDCERLGCPCFADPQTCIFSDNQKTQRVIDGSLDLINRQKAEIERLQKAYLMYEETSGLKWARAETIKEFAERLKCKSQYTTDKIGKLQKVVYVEDIDNLVKEMTDNNLNN